MNPKLVVAKLNFELVLFGVLTADAFKAEFRKAFWAAP
jgi:hypothetical protein